MPNVVFHNGSIDLGDGTIELYYGDDLVTCGARLKIAELLEQLQDGSSQN